jgi:cold shock CspA family protein
MPTGTVKVFGSNGYGFIAPDRGGADASVQSRHVAAGSLDLCVGQRVRFESRRGPMGPQAINVRAFDPTGKEHALCPTGGPAIPSLGEGQARASS